MVRGSVMFLGQLVGREPLNSLNLLYGFLRASNKLLSHLWALEQAQIQLTQVWVSLNLFSPAQALLKWAKDLWLV